VRSPSPNPLQPAATKAKLAILTRLAAPTSPATRTGLAKRLSLSLNQLQSRPQSLTLLLNRPLSLNRLQSQLPSLTQLLSLSRSRCPSLSRFLFHHASASAAFAIFTLRAAPTFLATPTRVSANKRF
jgi:hypothetical protein